MISRVSPVSLARIPLYVITWMRHRKSDANASCARPLLGGELKTRIRSRLTPRLIEPPILMKCVASTEKQKNDGMPPTRKRRAPGQPLTQRKTQSKPGPEQRNGERLTQIGSKTWRRRARRSVRETGPSSWNRNARDITRTQRRNCASSRSIALIRHSLQERRLTIANTGSCILSSPLFGMRQEKRQGSMRPRIGATWMPWPSSIGKPDNSRSIQASTTRSTISCRFAQNTSAASIFRKISKS